MKDFLKRILVFVLIAFTGLNILGYARVQPYFIQYMNERKGGWLKVYERINRSKTNIQSKRIYIGDSVGNQLFDFDTDTNSLTTNAAVSIAGNYILVNNLINNNSDIEEIVLLSVPNDIGWNFEQKLTHNNFVKPFLSFGNLKYFDDLLRDKLREKPLSWMYLFFGIKILPFSDIDFSDKNSIINANYLEEIKLTTLSDIAISYLKRLELLCSENNIRLYVISPPVPIHWKNDSNNWDEMRKQIDENNLNELLDNYINTINYLPDDCFIDGLHLKNQYIQGSKDNVNSILNNK